MKPKQFVLVVLLIGLYSPVSAQFLWNLSLPKDPQPLLVKQYFYTKTDPGKAVLYQVDKYTPDGPKFLTETYIDGILSSFTKYKYNEHGDEVLKTRTSVSGEVLFTTTTQNFYNEGGKRIRSVYQVNDQEPREIRINHQIDGGWTERSFAGGFLQSSVSFDAKGRVVGESSSGTNSGAIYSRDEHGEVSYIRENHEEGHNVYHLTNKYRPDGKLEKVFRDNSLEKTYYYDEKGRRTKVTFFERDGKAYQYVEYHYSAE